MRLPRYREQLAVGGHHFESRDRGRESADPVARAVRSGRHRARDRYVRERREVRESETVLEQHGGEVAVPRSRAHGHLAVADGHLGRQTRDAHEVAARQVGESRERVPASEGAHGRQPGDELLQLPDRGGAVQPARLRSGGCRPRSFRGHSFKVTGCPAGSRVPGGLRKVIASTSSRPATTRGSVIAMSRASSTLATR